RVGGRSCVRRARAQGCRPGHHLHRGSAACRRPVMTVNTDQARTVIIGEARSPVGVSLGLRLIGDEEVATITLTQHDQAVILHCADQAHAARIAAAIEALPAAPAVPPEPVAVPQVMGIGRDTSLPRAVILYLRSEPTDDDIRSIQDALRTGWVQPAEQQPFEWP